MQRNNNSEIWASIVTYATPQDELRECVSSLLRDGVGRIFIVDNSPEDSLRTFVTGFGGNISYIFTGKNLGYGKAHNIAMRESLSKGVKYHLVINSDVRFGRGTLPPIKDYMDARPDVGQVIPSMTYPDGTPQYSVRLLPAPADLLFRRFLPARWGKKRDDRYLLKFWDHGSEADIPYHQGSFMFLRTDALRSTGLFDERFFMYPEDIDLTRRIHRNWKTMFWPGVSVIHDHRAASYKSLRMLRIHAVNMIRYFNKWGWIFDSERRVLNRNVLKDLNRNS